MPEPKKIHEINCGCKKVWSGTKKMGGEACVCLITELDGETRTVKSSVAFIEEEQGL